MGGLVTIVGPTAVGKSELAFEIAQQFDGEIVSADSRQVYRYLNIGTAKPTLAQRAVVPHHLIDIVDPDEIFSLALYQKLAYAAIKDIQKRGKLPLLVGGTGLYIWSVVEGWQIPQAPPDPEFRRYLEDKAKKEGGYVLYQELQRIDPVAAQRIIPNNLRRVIRALEIYKITGYPPSQLWHKQKPSFPILIIGLTTDRDNLYRRVDLRVDKMIKEGLITETQNLLAMGYSLDLPAMSGIGYKQIGMFLQGKLSLPSAIQEIKYKTHSFVRRQYTWFRLSDERIRWFELTDKLVNEVAKTIANFLDKFKDDCQIDFHQVSSYRE